jgi:hypothetical protein
MITIKSMVADSALNTVHFFRSRANNLVKLDVYGQTALDGKNRTKKLVI